MWHVTMLSCLFPHRSSILSLVCIFKVPCKSQPRRMDIALCSDLVTKDWIQMIEEKKKPFEINNAGTVYTETLAVRQKKI